MQIFKTMFIAAAGMKAQSNRMRVAAENMANANSTANAPGQDPYRRMIPTFENHLNREMGVNLVRMKDTVGDKAPFGMRYDPNHPAADEDGYIQLPNVNSLVEMVDMRDAQRTFEANLRVVDASRSMLMRTIDLLRS